MADNYEILSLPRLEINTPLVDKKLIEKTFGQNGDVIELHIYSMNGDLIMSETPFTDFILPNPGDLNTEIQIDPRQILLDRGFYKGKYNLRFNFQRYKIFNTEDNYLSIKEISNSRTEIRAVAPNIPNSTLRPPVESFISEIDTSAYFKEFILNFGDDKNVVGINILLNRNPEKFEVLFKLFEPLPDNIFTQNSFKIVESITDPKSVEVDLGSTSTIAIGVGIRGPNFNIETKRYNSSPTDFKNFNEILEDFAITSSRDHLISKLNNFDEIPNIRYDYIRPISGSDSNYINENSYHFENFVHFGSATEMLKNFKFKLELLESYDSKINEINTTSLNTGYINNARKDLIDKKRKITNAFSGYEKFLYFDSGTYSWPKTNNPNTPVTSSYTLATVDSTAALEWLGSENDQNAYYGGQLLSASLFDRDNPYTLTRTLPNFITDNDDNGYYISFIDMIGQHFDHIWLYIKHITEKNNAHNLHGISKDLVYNQLKSLGIETFDQFENSSLYEYILGEGTSGSQYFNVNHFHNYSANHPSSSFGLGLAVSASETLITASNDGSIPKQDISKEIWKRLYHNAPYLLKTKGTERGIRALMACYGVPSTILNIKEYGGPTTDKTTYKTFSYDKSGLSLKGGTTGSGYFIKTPWSSSLTNELRRSGKTVEFRIKPIRSGSNSHHLFSLSGSNPTKEPVLVLNPHTGNDVSSSGDRLEYGQLDLRINDSVVASTSNFPIFNGKFWNIFIGTHGTSGSSADIKFGAYQSNNFKRVISHTASISQTQNDRALTFGDPFFEEGVGGSEIGSGFEIGGYYGPHIGGATFAYFGGMEESDDSEYNNVDTLGYSGSMQEIRYHFGELLSHDTFKKHALEPFMYAGNTPSSSYENLILRLPLGSNNQQNPSSSFHPNINVKYIPETPSQATAQLIFTNLNDAFTNSPLLTNLGQYNVSLTIIDTSGVSKTYLGQHPDGGGIYSNFSNGDLTPDGEVFFKVKPYALPISNPVPGGMVNSLIGGTLEGGGSMFFNLAQAINSENGHNGSIIATVDGSNPNPINRRVKWKYNYNLSRKQ